MSYKESAALAVGAVLLFAGVAFPQPLFAPPVNLGPKINTSTYESDPFWDAPRNRLYFISARDNEIPKIFFADWTDTGWADPVKLGPQINTGDVKSPSVSPDGQKLYLVSSWIYGYDVWVSTRDSSTNDWGAYVNLGYPVNTQDGEWSAHIAPDGRLFFSSCCWPDSVYPFGRCGIFASEWNNSSWSFPQLQWGCGVSTDYPSVPVNNHWLYFQECCGNIFVVGWNNDSGWVYPAYNISQQLGGRGATPFITPSGDSLFFAGTPDFGGYGHQDIWLAKRLMLGDLNLDNQLTPADVVLELNKVFLDEPFPAVPQIGDLNCDNLFTAADVVLILYRIFMGIPFPC